mgnify:CR=1 FL=1
MSLNEHPQVISLYLHIPFCRRKCSYCDFLSYPDQLNKIGDYVNALIIEIKSYQRWLAGRLITTVFLGGGTPSLLSPTQVNRIIKTISQTAFLAKDAEITLEANPEGLSEERILGYREAGINRLSIGLQSTDPTLLRLLGRHHSVEDYNCAVVGARRAGINNINTDLIFGIPGQKIETWQSTLEIVKDLHIPHISCYGLTYEEGTTFKKNLAKGIMEPADEELEWSMYRYAIAWLQEQGYEHYEISNYAVPGNQCRHNLTYWENREYIGLGAGAHGFYHQERWENYSLIDEYLYRIQNNLQPVKSKMRISEAEAVGETMFLGLRLRQGVSEERFYQRHGNYPDAYFDDKIKKLVKLKWLKKEDGYIRLTEAGFDLANQVFMEFLAG